MKSRNVEKEAIPCIVTTWIVAIVVGVAMRITEQESPSSWMVWMMLADLCYVTVCATKIANDGRPEEDKYNPLLIITFYIPMVLVMWLFFPLCIVAYPFSKRS